MSLFPFTRPCTGLYFSTDMFCAGQIQYGMDGPKLSGYMEQSLPAESIRLSPLEQNIASPEHILPIMQSNLCLKKRSPSVAVCLPDLCARVVVLELVSLPKNKQEQKVLVEWRLQKELNLSMKPQRLSYQIFSAVQSGLSTTHSPSVPVRILAVTIQNNIIERYEKLCLGAGIIPVSISVSGLAVLNLCRPVIEATLQAHAQNIAFVPDTVIFLYVGDWGFSLIVFRDGQPHFVRVKPIRQLSALCIQPSQSLNSHRQDPTAMLARELVGSLQFFFETTLSSEHQTHVYPVFLAGSLQPEVMLPKIAETVEQAFPLSGETGIPQVKPFPIFPQNLDVRAKTLSGLTHWTSKTLAISAAGYQPS